MPIQAIVSGSPSLGFAGEPAVEPLRSWHRELHGPEGWRAWWILPTSRRRRAVARTVSAAARLPRAMTIEGLVQQLLGFSRLQARTIGNTGRLLRLARACQQVDSRNPPTVGRVLQLDAIADRWRTTTETAPAGGTGAILARYDEILRAEGVLDAPALMRALARELADPDSALARRLAGRSIVFDGFERFAEAELDLIDALGRVADVRLWLVGAPGHPHRPDAEAIVARLRIANPIDDPREVSKPSHIDFHEAASPERECRAVAAHVKDFVRSTGARLADVAVVIPDDAYLPPLEDAFAAAGLLATPVAESFALAASRPVRALLAALRLVRRGWPADALFDFLRQPLVRRRLRHDWALDRLSTSAPVERSDLDAWLRRWRSAPDDDRVMDLVDSIEELLAPLRDLDADVLPDRFAALVATLGRWLDRLGLGERLGPTNIPDWTVVPAREWEIDQLAFNNLRDVFDELRATPPADLPARADGTVDVAGLLKLALAAESFQTGSHDDAGVQIVRARAVRGTRFRAVYAVGLVEGLVPSDPGRPADDDALADRKRAWRDESLREQHGQFVQLFASAAERLVLSRPRSFDGVPARESRFLREARGERELRPFPSVPVADFRDALADPAVAAAELAAPLETRRLWRTRPADDALRIEDWAMPVFAERHPAHKAFGATTLEQYAACPFRHFVTHTLRLGELEDDDEARRWGTLVHAAMDGAYRAKDDPRPIDVRFRDHLRAAFDSAQPRFDSTRLHDYEYAFFAVYAAVSGFLAEHGFTQQESEWEQKDFELPDGVGGSFRLHVKIDRIDRRADGAELICDFKTGRMMGKKKIAERLESGRALQLPLYALVRQTATGRPVAHGVYVHFHRGIQADPALPAKFLIQMPELAPTRDRVKLPFDPAAAGQTAARLVGELRAGRIPLTRFDVDHSDPACAAHCPARHACRHQKGY